MNTPSVFQRLMQQVVTAVNPVDGPTFVTAYIDDLLVFSSSLTEHFDHLHLILEKLREVGLKLNPAKCCFLRKEFEYLGYVIAPTGLKPNAKLVTAARDYAPPQNVKELKRFLGLASYYRRFIPQFAKIAHPLHQLTRKDVNFSNALIPVMWPSSISSSV